jgi:hypothetical protein
MMLQYISLNIQLHLRSETLTKEQVVEQVKTILDKHFKLPYSEDIEIEIIEYAGIDKDFLDANRR